MYNARNKWFKPKNAISLESTWYWITVYRNLKFLYFIVHDEFMMTDDAKFFADWSVDIFWYIRWPVNFVET